MDYSAALEEAPVRLIRHGLSKTLLDPAEEEEENLSKRFGDSSSAEHKFPMSCVTKLW